MKAKFEGHLKFESFQYIISFVSMKSKTIINNRKRGNK